jgi:transcriptional regulator GlxA family with amidase domain
MNSGFHAPAGSAHYQDIVDRAIAMTRASPADEIRVADICRALGISPRALARAFKTIHDTSPYRYLCGLRLMEARQVLLATASGRSTVTQIALRFGFSVLGRFAALYRAKFGETPSATLRRSSPDSGDQSKHRVVGTGDSAAGACDQPL